MTARWDSTSEERDRRAGVCGIDEDLVFGIRHFELIDIKEGKVLLMGGMFVQIPGLQGAEVLRLLVDIDLVAPPKKFPGGNGEHAGGRGLNRGF